MNRMLLLAAVLCAFVATNAYATPQPLDIYGGWDPSSTPTWWYLTDFFGYPLEDGDCVAVYWKGPDGLYNGIDVYNAPNPLGDDSLMVEAFVEYAGFFISFGSYQVGDDHPQPCDEIYVVMYDDSCAALDPTNYYGVSQQHHVENFMGETMYCHFTDEKTDTPLPVSLLSFDAMARDGEVMLTWKTASETGCNGFHIERSVDEAPWTRLTEGNMIQSAGSSTTENTYTYLDKGLVNETTYYYNLFTVDVNGVEEKANEHPLEATPSANVPNKFALHQNSPNPFNPATEIKYEIPRDVQVTLKVYNILGAEVATLVDAHQKANFYTVTWDATDLASGVYFCVFSAGGFKDAIKMVFLK